MSDTGQPASKASQPRPPRRRRSLIWRLVKWTLLVLLILIVIVVGLVAWVAGTRSGTSFAWNEIKPHLPKSIQVASIEGRLIGPLHVRGVKIDTASSQIAVKSVDLDWDASQLWSRTVHVKNLAVGGVNYKVTKLTPPKKKKPTKPFSLPKAIHLPVAVQIDRVAVDNVTAITAPKAKPVVVNKARLIDARLDNAQWHIQSLTGTGPLFDINAKAKVTPKGGYATHLNVQAKLRLPKLAPIAATAKIKGQLDDLHLNMNVAAPYNLALAGQVKNALKKPAVDLALHVKNIHTQAIKASLPKVAASADVTVRGRLDDLAVDLASHVDSAAYGKAVLKGAIDYTPKTVTIQNLKLTTPATGGALTANGQVALAKGHTMNMAVDWSGLQWPLSGKARYRSDTGRVHLTGALSDYKLDTQLAWQVIGQTQGKLSLDGSGSTKHFDLAKLNISGGPGHITGTAKAAWSPALDVSAHLQGTHINPGAVIAKVPGDFNLNANISAAKQNGVLQASIHTLRAHGSLRHQPLDLNAKARYLGDHVVVDNFHLVTGATTADISGRYGWKPDSALNGQWSIDSSDLSSLWPSLAGSLKARGQVAGRVKAPKLNATLDANHIAAAGSKVAHAGVDARVDWSGATQSKVDVNVDGVNAAGQAIKKVTLTLDGTPASHQLAVDLNSAIARASVALNGHLNKKTYRYRYTLNRLRAAYQKLAPWSLAAPASGMVSAKAQSIDNACLTSRGARLCLKANHDKKSSTAHIALSDFDYGYAKSFFPSGMNVTGSVSGTVDAVVPTGGNPDVDANLHTTAGRVTMVAPATGKRVRILDMQPGQITARMRHNGLNANVDLPLAGDSGVHARLGVAPGKGALTTHALSGRLRLSLTSLSFIEQLSPEVADFKGNIDGDMRISGTLARPTVLGKMAINAPRIVLITPGLTLTGVKLAAVGHGHSIAINAAAHSGGGSLNANGTVALNRKGQVVDLAIQGDRFQVADIPNVRAYISPDLAVKVTPSRVDVNGSVTIPEAEITPRNLPATGVTTVSSDQVIVSNKAPAKKTVARAIHANIKVVLGKKVSIDGFGLKANLNGKLRVVQQPGSTTTGTGAINIVNGSYKAYGQSLDIQQGKILFAGGPVSGPGIQLKAARYPTKDVTVGVQVQGSVLHPQVTLFSDPSMTQSEQLSWLLLGRPLNNTTGQQSSMVARAALALGGSHANQVLQDIGNKLGVNVGLGSGAGQSSSEAALTVGKYLSPRLYVSYGLGLFDQVSTVSMSYTLSSHWRLETESSGKATGGDIIYSIDR